MSQTLQQPATADPADREAIRPFTFDVSDEELADLRRRVSATRWPDRETDPSQGVRLDDDPGAGQLLGDGVRLAQRSRSALRPCPTSSPRSTASTSTSSTFARSTRTRCR